MQSSRVVAVTEFWPMLLYPGLRAREGLAGLLNTRAILAARRFKAGWGNGRLLPMIANSSNLAGRVWKMSPSKEERQVRICNLTEAWMAFAAKREVGG